MSNEDIYLKQLQTFAEALALAQAELEGATKDAKNPHFRSNYATLASVWEAWQNVGPKHGFSILQLVRDAGERQGIQLETILLHKSGASERSVSFWPAVKQDAQGYGSALTYARRYTLAAMVGVCPEDDDGNAAALASKNQAAEDEARFEAAFNKYTDDSVKLSVILGEASKAGLSGLVSRINKRIEELKK